MFFLILLNEKYQLAVSFLNWNYVANTKYVYSLEQFNINLPLVVSPSWSTQKMYLTDCCFDLVLPGCLPFQTLDGSSVTLTLEADGAVFILFNRATLKTQQSLLSTL